MQRIVWDMSKVNNDILEIVPLADLHIGDPQCQMDLIKSEIKKIADTPNRYFVLDGDLLNTATKSSVSDVYTETMTPMQELNAAVELFKPIKDKCLAICSGNHENRISKETSISMMRLFARELELENIYADGSAILFLKFGQPKSRYDRHMVYTMLMSHGSGGGSKVGSKASKLSTMSDIAVCDIYLIAHTHQPLSFKKSIYVCNHTNCTFRLVEQTFVNTASSLSYGGYGETAMYTPASNTYPVIRLHDRVKKVSVIL